MNKRELWNLAKEHGISFDAAKFYLQGECGTTEYRRVLSKWNNFKNGGFVENSAAFHVWRGAAIGTLLVKGLITLLGKGSISPYEHTLTSWFVSTEEYVSPCFGEALLIILSHDPSEWPEFDPELEEAVFEKGEKS